MHVLLYSGIVAGAWPCGIITMMGELFNSELKTQIYGFLHAFIQENENEMDDLSTCILFVLHFTTYNRQHTYSVFTMY